MGLQQFERRLERLVEGVFAKAFRSGLEPVEIARRLTRDMESHRTVGTHGVIVPNHYVVTVGPADHERFASFADSLVGILGDAVREHARDENYGFLGPVEVELANDERLKPGQFDVSGEIRSAPGGLMPAALVGDDGRRVPVGSQPVTIGRLPECEIVLDDANVSRRHAEVRRRDGDVVVVDLGSTNGTRVNGTMVKEHRLADGDEITVGSTRLRFETS